MPAATGINIRGKELVIIFLASKEKPEHIENPLQVSSYDYPTIYGKKPPAFARATKVNVNKENLVFLSGTASIRGHKTLHQGNIIKQLETTIENIDVLLDKIGVKNKIASESLTDIRPIIYVRKIEDLEKIYSHLWQYYPRYANAIFVAADVCRDDLDMEISLTLALKD